MELIDISMPVEAGMTVWGDRPEKQPQLIPDTRMPVDRHNESTIRMSLHNGTHADAPFHMVDGGTTIERIPLDRYFRPCRVFDLTHVTDAIHEKDVADLDLPAGGFALFKTRNSSSKPWSPTFIYLAADAARHLAASGISGVGTDGLGVERDQHDHATHLALFAADILIVEGLRLAHVEPGDYRLIAFPLLIPGADGAPVRAALLRGQS